MIGADWSFEHSVDCPVTPAFAWQFWSHAENWMMDADVERIEFDGPFMEGARGATITRSSGRIEWRLARVYAGKGAVIEMPAGGAVLRFQWSFAPTADGTRITQRISVVGEGAARLAEQVAPMFEPNLPAGMQKLCEVMAKAFRAG